MTNRITEATKRIPIKDLDGLRRTLKSMEYRAVEAAPAFDAAFAESPNRAMALARGFAGSLATTEEHRQLFQSVASMDEDRRRTLIKGYRQEG